MSIFSFDSIKADILRSLDFFNPLGSEAIGELAESCEEIILNPKEILFKEGELGDSMYIILHGSLSIERQNIVIAKRRKGDHVGEMALIESGPRAATVKALSKTYLIKISKDQFHSHFISNHQALMEILKTISERSREDLAALEQSMKSLHAQKKITTRLQDLLDNTSNEIYTLDFETFRFTYMNPRALANLGCQSKEITQLKPMDIIQDINPRSLKDGLLFCGRIKKRKSTLTQYIKGWTILFIL